MDDDEPNAVVTTPAPSGNGELDSLTTIAGTPLDEGDDVQPTTNRAYFQIRGDALELTAAEARSLAGMLRTAADSLEKYHDVRMPIEDGSEL